jgi:hypothetical protein
VRELSERLQRAIDTAYRAQGFPEYLHGQGLIGRGNEVREAIASILLLTEVTAYPPFALEPKIEIADALAVLLDAYRYDSGKRSATTTQGNSHEQKKATTS